MSEAQVTLQYAGKYLEFFLDKDLDGFYTDMENVLYRVFEGN